MLIIFKFFLPLVPDIWRASFQRRIDAGAVAACSSPSTNSLPIRSMIVQARRLGLIYALHVMSALHVSATFIPIVCCVPRVIVLCNMFVPFVVNNFPFVPEWSGIT